MKKTLEDQINECASYIFDEKVVNFLYDVIPLFELYDVEDDGDWVVDAVGADNEANIRALRTVYLMSKIAERHSGVLAHIRGAYPRLYMRMKDFAGIQEI